MSIVSRAYEVQVICQQYACKDIDREDAHNELVRAGLLDVEAADLLDIHDRALAAAIAAGA